MNVQRFIDEIRVMEGRARGELFWLFVKEVVSVALGSDGALVEAPPGLDCDGVLSSGVSGLPGPTAVEAKSFLRPTGTITWLRSRSQRAAIERLRSGGVNSRLFVLSDDPPSRSIGREVSTAASGGPFPTLVWGPKELQAIVDKHPSLFASVAPTPEGVATIGMRRRLREELPIKGRDSPSTQHAASELARALSDDELVLFLGAGVSIPAGISDWDELLSLLLVEMVSRLDPRSSHDMETVRLTADHLRRAQAASPLLTARYVRAGLGDGYAGALRSALYRKLKDTPGPYRTPLLGAIAKLSVPPRNGRGVNAIITYNYDDLVEEALGVAGVSARPVDREDSHVPRLSLPIFHVHGFLPRLPAPEEHAIAPESVVLSEERYHSLYNDPYNWANLVQLSHLRDFTCLFVGLSMTDPNLRRLLEIATRSSCRPRHYALLRRQSADASVFEGDENSKRMLERALDTHHEIQERSFRELGVNVVWYDEHSEVPTFLNQLRTRI